MHKWNTNQSLFKNTGFRRLMYGVLRFQFKNLCSELKCNETGTVYPLVGAKDEGENYPDVERIPFGALHHVGPVKHVHRETLLDKTKSTHLPLLLYRKINPC
ncbi:hypothetical protein CEXT_772131 [Caerostris extrusa]|uniref:Uncharacterized protein n=1 Tax=Caerostris extrusa TaxID=172846 RepID=A0AAV4XHS7_CAEEX|nr:hypothetical protein CEXT_772131 [Caerostris extrusa]